MDSIKTPKVLDAKLCWLHNMYLLLLTTQTTWWESPGTVDILYTVSPPRWIEEDWKRIFYLPFIKMNWTIAYKTLLLLNGLETHYWFLYTFPHIGLFSYHETSIHVLDYYATHTCPVYSACSKSIWWGIYLFSFFWKLGLDFILFQRNNVCVQAFDEKSNYFQWLSHFVYRGSFDLWLLTCGLV